VPVTVIAWSAWVVFPELVLLQLHHGDFLPAPIEQLALREPGAERLPAVHLHEKTNLSLDLAAVHGTEELARIEAVRDVINAATAVFGLCVLLGELPGFDGHGHRKEAADLWMGLEVGKSGFQVRQR
jgi:hypothetical protein